MKLSLFIGTIACAFSMAAHADNPGPVYPPQQPPNYGYDTQPAPIDQAPCYQQPCQQQPPPCYQQPCPPQVLPYQQGNVCQIIPRSRGVASIVLNGATVLITGFPAQINAALAHYRGMGLCLQIVSPQFNNFGYF